MIVEERLYDIIEYTSLELNQERERNKKEKILSTLRGLDCYALIDKLQR